MSSRRFERWHTRPAQRSRSSRYRRAKYTREDMMKQFDLGVDIGYNVARAGKDAIRRVADAIRNDTLDELAREVGVTPPIDPDAIDADDIGDAFEQWLREQDGGDA